MVPRVRAASASSAHTTSGGATTAAAGGAVDDTRVQCRTASAGGDTNLATAFSAVTTSSIRKPSLLQTAAQTI